MDITIPAYKSIKKNPIKQFCVKSTRSSLLLRFENESKVIVFVSIEEDGSNAHSK